MSDTGLAVAYDPVSAPDGATGYARAYASTIKGYDLLERGQEQELARRWHERRDQRASDALVTSHLRLAARVARGYQGYGLPLADLIAEGNLGLVMAAARFKPDQGSRFSTYALWWIKAAIHEYILRSWSLVRIGTTSAQRRLFFGLKREMRKFTRSGNGLTPDTIDAVAAALQVTRRDVIEMNSRLSGDLSLNAPVSDDSQAVEWEAMLADESPDAETIVAETDEAVQRSKALRAALHVLNERERQVFVARRLSEDPPSLEQLGRELSISSERVRQIEVRAFEKVRRAAAEVLMGRGGSIASALPAHA